MLPAFAGRYLEGEILVWHQDRLVLRTIDAFTGEPVILKGVCARPGDPAVAAVDREFELLWRQRHPRLARGLELAWAPAAPALELTSNDASVRLDPERSAFRYFTQTAFDGPSLSGLRRALAPDEIRVWLRETLELLAFLHEQGLAGLDLKPDHLIRSASGWCLIDLEQAARHSPLEAFKLQGTMRYAAPELLLGQPADKPSDLFSLGAILLEVLTETPPPLGGETPEAQARWLLSRPAPTLTGDVEARDPAVAALMTRLLQRSPLLRPSAGEALEALGVSGTAWRHDVPLPESVFVGRDPALRALEAAGSDAAATSGAALWLTGPPASGRTRFLREITLRWWLEHRPVFAVEPQHASSSALPWCEALERHLLQVAGELDGRAAGGEAARRYPSEYGASGDESSRRQAWIVQQVTRLRAAGRAAMGCTGLPIPVVIDRVDALDEVSLEVLETLCRVADGSGQFLVRTGTSSNDCPPGRPHISLDCLEHHAVRAMAEGLLGEGALDRSTLDALLRGSDGLPGRCLGMLEPLWRDPGRPRACIGAPGDDRTAQLISEMSPMARSVAAAASLLEAPFDPNILESLIEMVLEKGLLTSLQDSGREGTCPSAGALCDVLASFVTRGILTVSRNKAGEMRYRFTSETLRLMLEQGPSEPVRRELHRCAGELLEQGSQADRRTSPRQLAAHFLAGGLPERARPYLQQAVEDAIQRQRLTSAANHLQALIGTYEARSSGVGPLLIRLGGLEYGLRRFSNAREAFARALELRLTPERRAAALAGLARAEIARDNFTAARSALADAIALDAELPSDERIRWHHLDAWLALRMFRLEEASRALEAAQRLKLPPRSLLEVEHVYYRAWLGFVQSRPIGGLIADAQVALATAQELNHGACVLQILSLLAQMYRRSGDLPAALRCLDAHIGRSREAFDLVREAKELLNRGNLLLDMGRSEEALESFERAADLGLRARDWHTAARNLLSAADLLLVNGRTDAAEARLQGVDAALEKVDEPGISAAWCAISRAWLRLLRDESAGLEETVIPAVEQLERAGMVSLAAHGHVVLAELDLVRGRPAEAMARVDATHERIRGAEARFVEARLNGLAERARRLNLTTTDDDRLTGNAITPVPPTWADPLFWLDRLQVLLEATHDEDMLARALAELVGKCFEGRGMVLVAEGARFSLLGGEGHHGGIPDDLSRTVMKRVLKTGDAYVCDDILIDRAGIGDRTMRVTRSRSIMCWPIQRQANVLGVLYADHPKPGRFAGQTARDVMARVAGLAAEQLEGIVRRRQYDEPEAPEFDRLIGDSPPMRKLRRAIDDVVRFGGARPRMLLIGEVGTGKSLIAEIIHERIQETSDRSGRFVAINCAAIPEALIESVLFGHVRGAFTGAVENQSGKLKEAEGGTLFLDEVHRLSLAAQQKLLTALSSLRYMPLGSHKEHVLDIVLICATSANLWEMVAAGEFQDNFFSRIYCNPIDVPPLRERGASDILLVAQSQVRKILAETAQGRAADPAIAFTRAAQAFLSTYRWPRNVRELEGILSSARVRKRLLTGQQVEVEDIEPFTQAPSPAVQAGSELKLPLPPPGLMFAELEGMFKTLVKEYCLRELTRHPDVSKTARALGISRSTFYRFSNMTEDMLPAEDGQPGPSSPTPHRRPGPPLPAQAPDRRPRPTEHSKAARRRVQLGEGSSDPGKERE